MKKLIILSLLLFASVARAEDSPCGPGYGAPETLQASQRVDFARGVVGPDKEAIFTLPFSERLDVACVSQKIRFDEGFDFNRGGKLPVIFGGKAPMGCVKEEVEGFTLRAMWRRNGDGQVQFHDMDVGGECGQNMGRGRWTFPAGKDIELGWEIILNTPGLNDGILRIWADGKMVVQRFAMLYRRAPETKIDGLLFSAYFGGSTPDWASPKDQGLDFGALRLWRRTEPLPPSP